MRKEAFFFIATWAIIIQTHAQSVKFEDRFGDDIIYVDGNTIRSKDRFG
ncbi:MAG: hypothetical protein RLZZ262_814, partial [Bacteroidota bacterium]